MSNTYMGGTVSVGKTGITVTTAATSAQTAIPTDSAGNLPRYIRIAATAESYVKLGPTGVAATTNDLLVQPADSVIVSVGNAGFFAVIQGTASGKVNVVPLDNA